MIEGRGQARLAHEPMGEQRVVVEVQPLERHVPVEGGLAGAIHDRHAASREHSNDLVASDPLRIHGLQPTLPQRRRAEGIG